jgi:hypothetical protein
MNKICHIRSTEINDRNTEPLGIHREILCFFFLVQNKQKDLQAFRKSKLSFFCFIFLINNQKKPNSEKRHRELL